MPERPQGPAAAATERAQRHQEAAKAGRRQPAPRSHAAAVLTYGTAELLHQVAAGELVTMADVSRRYGQDSRGGRQTAGIRNAERHGLVLLVRRGRSHLVTLTAAGRRWLKVHPLPPAAERVGAWRKAVAAELAELARRAGRDTARARRAERRRQLRAERRARTEDTATQQQRIAIGHIRGPALTATGWVLFCRDMPLADLSDLLVQPWRNLGWRRLQWARLDAKRAIRSACRAGLIETYAADVGGGRTVRMVRIPLQPSNSAHLAYERLITALELHLAAEQHQAAAVAA